MNLEATPRVSLFGEYESFVEHKAILLPLRAYAPSFLLPTPDPIVAPIIDSMTFYVSLGSSLCIIFIYFVSHRKIGIAEISLAQCVRIFCFFIKLRICWNR